MVEAKRKVMQDSDQIKSQFWNFLRILSVLSILLRGSCEGEKYLPCWPQMRVKEEKAK